MRKLSLLKNVMLAGAVLALASCGKDEPVDPTQGFNVSDPASVIENLQISKIIDDEGEYVFSYKDNQLTSVKRTEKEVDDWGTYESNANYSFIYTNDQLSSVKRESFYKSTPNEGTASSGGNTFTVSYEYNEEGLISKITRNRSEINSGNTYTDNWITGLEYNNENRLVKETSLEEDGEPVTMREWAAYEWSGQNVAEWGFYYEENAEGARKLSAPQGQRFSLFNSRLRGSNESVMEEKYVLSDFDDKANPLAIFGLMNGHMDGMYVSANNAGRVVAYSQNDNGELVEDEVMTFTYEYDEKGRPVKYISTSQEDGDEPEVSEITIVYKN